MLPMRLQFMIVMIASAINDRLQRKLDYVEGESRILREQLDAATGGKKLSFTTDQRRRLATAGKLLTPDERRTCCHLVKPATILVGFASSLQGSTTAPRPAEAVRPSPRMSASWSSITGRPLELRQ